MGRSASAKEFEPKAIELAVRARIRHRFTNYDDLLFEGMTVTDAGAEIRPDLDRVCDQWRAGGEGHPVRADSISERSHRVTPFDAASIRREVAYIVGQARKGVGKLVGLGPLVFLSAGSGDAWVLDRADALATWLAEGGREKPSRVLETESRVGIEWNGSFELQGDDFVFIDRRGEVRSFEGYPMNEIRRFL